jgi:hypothetical protein
MNTRQPRLELVNSSLQLGTAGIKLTNSSNALSVKLKDGVTLANISAADPTSVSHVCTKNYFDTLTSAIYNSSGTRLTNVKRILLQTTTNSAGAWSVNLPNLGQTQVVNINASIVSLASEVLPGVAIVHIKQFSTSQISGLSSLGSTITTLLLGSAATLISAPAGLTVFVDALVI